MTFVEALTGSPILYPIALDAPTDVVQFIRLTAADCAAASFLDRRLLNPGVPTAPVPWADVRAAAENLPVRCHFIFHISHVGSTLLSRLVGHHPSLLSLREPAILRQLADMHRVVDQPECSWSRQEFGDRLRTFLALWSRAYEPNQIAVIKATSFVSEMSQHLMDRVATAKSIFTYVSLPTFLKALLGGAMSDIDSGIGKRLVRLERRFGGPRWRQADLSPGERVALSWLTEMSALHAAGHRYPDRVLWMDFDQFLEMPVVGLTAALSLFGVGDAADAAATILTGPTMRQYAKAPAQEFDARFRRQLLDQAEQQHAQEIRKGMAWLERAAAIPAVRMVLDAIASRKALADSAPASQTKS